eukprot:1189352-Prorocentrum_minimum.AAC.8
MFLDTRPDGSWPSANAANHDWPEYIQSLQHERPDPNDELRHRGPDHDFLGIDNLKLLWRTGRTGARGVRTLENGMTMPLGIPC